MWTVHNHRLLTNSIREINDMLINTNMVTVLTFEVRPTYDKLNEHGSVLMEIMHRNKSLNCIIINLYLILASPYWLKHLKLSRRYTPFPEFIIIILIKNITNAREAYCLQSPYQSVNVQHSTLYVTDKLSFNRSKIEKRWPNPLTTVV
jgi:hypothetical protein